MRELVVAVILATTVLTGIQSYSIVLLSCMASYNATQYAI